MHVRKRKLISKFILCPARILFLKKKKEEEEKAKKANEGSLKNYYLTL